MFTFLGRVRAKDHDQQKHFCRDPFKKAHRLYGNKKSIILHLKHPSGASPQRLYADRGFPTFTERQRKSQR